MKIFSRLRDHRVLLLGDFNIDRYVLGEVSRISPEAPVPILRVHRTYDRPGGAGNAALGLRALGLTVRVIGRGCCGLEEVDLSGMVEQDDFTTPIKSRMVAESSAHQIMRVDEETIIPLDPKLEGELTGRLPELLDGVDLIAVSDYGKGMVTPRLLRALIDSGIPVVVDPKGRDFSRYRGVTLVKPNLREVCEAAGVSDLDEAARIVMERDGIEQLLVTRASEGASLFTGAVRQDFGVQLREVRDVTGAGDTVLATLVCALANELSMEEAVHLAMVAAGMAVEHPGCVAVTLSDLARRLFEENSAHKVFGEEDLYALSHILEGRDYNLLAISSPLSEPLLEAIRELGHPTLLFVEESEGLPILSALADSRLILVGAKNLQRLTNLVPPCEIFRFEGGEMHRLASIDSLFLSGMLS